MELWLPSELALLVHNLLTNREIYFITFSEKMEKKVLTNLV